MTATCAPDGTPIEAFALLPPGPAPDLLDARLPRSATVLDLGCGAGRIARVLAARGHAVAGVDQSPEMLERVPAGIETHLADIEGLDLGRRFDAVLLASFLVNTPFAEQRAAFLVAAAAHVAAGGAVYLQRLDPTLVPIAIDAESHEDGVVYAMSDVRHVDHRFEATMSFTIGAQRWEHRYAGEVLDDEPLTAALAAAGLGLVSFLDEQRTWVEARP